MKIILERGMDGKWRPHYQMSNSVEQKTRMYQTKGDYNNEDPRLAATNSDDLGRH